MDFSSSACSPFNNGADFGWKVSRVVQMNSSAKKTNATPKFSRLPRMAITFGKFSHLIEEDGDFLLVQYMETEK